MANVVLWSHFASDLAEVESTGHKGDIKGVIFSKNSICRVQTVYFMKTYFWFGMICCEIRLVAFFGPSIWPVPGLFSSPLPDRGALRTLSKLPTFEVTLLTILVRIGPHHAYLNAFNSLTWGPIWYSLCAASHQAETVRPSSWRKQQLQPWLGSWLEHSTWAFRCEFWHFLYEGNTRGEIMGLRQ